MPAKQTLLADISRWLSYDPESIAVEALWHILSSSEAARRAIDELLQAAGAEVGPVMSTEIQAGGEDETHRILVASTNEAEEHVLIEPKFWAGLIERQPAAFLERLPQDRPTALLVVAPGKRCEPLWAELRNRAQAANIALDSSHHAPDLWSASVGRKRRLVLTSWTALLDHMDDKATGEAEATLDIQQLRGLTESLDEDAFLPLRPDELGPESPRRILSLYRLIKDAEARASVEGWVENPMEAPKNTGFTVRILLAGADAWFGVNLDHWAQHRDTPLWLDFKNSSSMRHDEIRRRLESLLREDPPKLIDAGGLFAPIDLPTGVEYEAVLDAVVARLKHIADLIGQGATP